MATPLLKYIQLLLLFLTIYLSGGKVPPTCFLLAHKNRVLPHLPGVLPGVLPQVLEVQDFSEPLVGILYLNGIIYVFKYEFVILCLHYRHVISNKIKKKQNKHARLICSHLAVSSVLQVLQTHRAYWQRQRVAGCGGMPSVCQWWTMSGQKFSSVRRTAGRELTVTTGWWKYAKWGCFQGGGGWLWV